MSTKMNKYLFGVLFAGCNHVFVIKANNVVPEKYGELKELNSIYKAASLPA